MCVLPGHGQNNKFQNCCKSSLCSVAIKLRMTTFWPTTYGSSSIYVSARCSKFQATSLGRNSRVTRVAKPNGCREKPDMNMQPVGHQLLQKTRKVSWPPPRPLSLPLVRPSSRPPSLDNAKNQVCSTLQ